MSSGNYTIDHELLNNGPFASGTVKATIESRPDFESTRIIFRRIATDFIQIIGLMGGGSRHWEFIVKDNITLGEYDIKNPIINNVVYVQQITHDPEYDHVFLSESGKVTVTEVDFPKGILKFNFDVILWQPDYPGPRTKAGGTVDVSGMQQTPPASTSKL
ncbi:hypothetical protein ACYZT8_04750 [Pseudomonas sp. LB3P93]